MTVGAVRSAPPVPPAASAAPPAAPPGESPAVRRFAEQLASRVGELGSQTRRTKLGLAPPPGSGEGGGGGNGGACANKSPPRVHSAAHATGAARLSSLAAPRDPIVRVADRSASPPVKAAAAEKSSAQTTGGGGLRSFAALRAAADAHASTVAAATREASAQNGAAGKWEKVIEHVSPSMQEHERRVEDERLRRARQRADFLLQREEEAQIRAEVYALNKLMKRRELVAFEKCATQEEASPDSARRPTRPAAVRSA